MELNEFTQLFPNEDCCYEYLSFWVKNICCTNCGSKGLVWHKETKRWECPVCGFVISLETMFSLLRDYFPYDAGEIIWQYNYLMKKQINHSTEDTNHTPTREKVVYGSTEGEYAGSSSHKCDIYIPNAPKAGTTYENVAGSTIIPGALITIGIGGILGGLFSTKSHTVYSSVFAPAEVARGNDMMVQVYVYKDGEHEQVIKDAISADDSTSERRKKYDPLYFKLKEGDKVAFRLDDITH